MFQRVMFKSFETNKGFLSALILRSSFVQCDLFNVIAEHRDIPDYGYLIIISCTITEASKCPKGKIIIEKIQIEAIPTHYEANGSAPITD